ncbi:unnamed protein product [Clonostachys chloroleuca]|uniref:Uncharacterized protein n=1 Tax=Clonostachys chloroleuca TaxID=1926264 RepID=A0AA35M0Y3_9HYPO|nr:unnamed protein product [Clonostachys chloroleuca]
MAPPAADVDTSRATTTVPVQAKLKTSRQSAIREPLKEFPEVQLTEILKDDTKIRDLAITGKLIGNMNAHWHHHEIV